MMKLDNSKESMFGDYFINSKNNNATTNANVNANSNYSANAKK